MTRPAVVFADVHGDAFSLRILMRKIRGLFGQEVDIYSLGDLVDRGPDSKDVLDICVQEGVRGVIGNHEIWLHRYFATGEFDRMALHKSMKGVATLQSYGVHSTNVNEIERRLKHLVPQEHKDYILGLPVWRKIEVGGQVFRLCHAGIKHPEVEKYAVLATQWAEEKGISFSDALCETIADREPAFMLWQSPNLQSPNLHTFTDGSTQIFGHIPQRYPTVTRSWIALDTGSGTRPPYTITGMVLPSREIIQANRLSAKVPDSPGYHDFEP